MSAALELKGVAKRYGRNRALDGLDLSVPCGSIFGLVGSNGAGKTTAMTVSAGLLRPSAGTISLFGEGPFNAELHGGRISLLPQDARFPPHATVRGLLRYYGQLQGVGAAELEPSIENLLEWVHLSDRGDSAVKTLSHGMNRRLAIAQAFLGSPELVLLDEPLNGLDPVEAARVRDVIRERRGHQAVVISSHHLADIESLCDTVAFIEKGRLVRQDRMETITLQRHRITYALSGNAVVPLQELADALPGVAWETTAGGTTLTATFTALYTTEELNARVLNLLMGAGVGILEIRRGSDLETEYLRLHAVPAPPLPETK